MPIVCPGRYSARFAESSEDREAALTLRWTAFHAARGRAAKPGGDADSYDPVCRHVLIEDSRSGAVVACYRLWALPSGQSIDQSYSAQFYNLAGLRGYEHPMAEMSRFCLHPDHHAPDILRTAWGALARFVDLRKIAMLFGCSSFLGTDIAAHRDSLGVLAQEHLAPEPWRPLEKSPLVLNFARDLAGAMPDQRIARKSMPPLLRTYLTMGGWVSDHAVIDHDMDTLHVFTGLEIARIPPARARALRAIYG